MIGAFAAWFISQPQMEPLMTPERKARIQASPHYVNGEFVPETPHEPIRSTSDFWKDFFSPRRERRFPKINDNEKIDLKALDPAKNIVVWMGHSSFYMQLHGKKILIDPIADTYAADLVYR